MSEDSSQNLRHRRDSPTLAGPEADSVTPMSPERVWTVLRGVMAVVILAAVARQLAASIASALEYGRDLGVTVANFFSFFTILSNVSSAIVLTWAVVWFLTRGRDAGGLAAFAVLAPLQDAQRAAANRASSRSRSCR